MRLALYIIVMAGVTYLIRMIPFVFCRNKIKSRFFRSFLYYVPYAVLSAMTIPAIFYSTGSYITAAAGTAAATVLTTTTTTNAAAAAAVRIDALAERLAGARIVHDTEATGNFSYLSEHFVLAALFESALKLG